MNSREHGRVLFLGVLPDRSVVGFAVFATHPLARELDALRRVEEVGVFLDLSYLVAGDADTKSQLLRALLRIHQKKWIGSQKIGPEGFGLPYSAPNCGGYTLEAELGISPNGYAEPDYLGWEVKQYGVTNFDTYRAKSPVTLMTPEPTSGEYKDSGVADFLRHYGYLDNNGIQDRINFGGIYRVGQDYHQRTGLTLVLLGFDPETGKITDMDGGIHLISKSDNVAARWDYAGIMDHWNRKHARAVYVPSMSRKPPPEYSYGGRITLCEQTDFLLFLSAISSGKLYYDPGIKMENASGKRPKIKRRSQFRMRQQDIASLYGHTETIELVQ